MKISYHTPANNQVTKCTLWVRNAFFLVICTLMSVCKLLINKQKGRSLVEAAWQFLFSEDGPASLRKILYSVQVDDQFQMTIRKRIQPIQKERIGRKEPYSSPYNYKKERRRKEENLIQNKLLKNQKDQKEKEACNVPHSL